MARVVLTHPDGRKQTKSFYGRTKIEAQTKRNKFLESSGRVAREKVTLQEVADYSREHVWVHLAPKTATSYEFVIKRVAALLPMDVRSINPPMIASLLRMLAAEKLSANSLKNVRAVLSTLFVTAIEQGWCESNPVRDIRTPKSLVKTKRPEVITREELQKVIKSEPDPVYRSFWALLAETGLRPFKEGAILTRSSIEYHRDTYFVRVGESKTEAGESRLIPISDEVAKMIVDREGYLFQNSAGSPIEESKVHKAWNAALERAEVRHYRLYCLRNFALSDWINRGLPPDVIKAMAGHKSITITMDVYHRMGKDRLTVSVMQSVANVSDDLSIPNFED